MAKMAEFRRWYDKQAKAHGITHFAAHELVILSARRGVQNAMPPEDLWTNCLPTLVVLDRLRTEIDLPLVITSGYRSPEYNRAIGGAEKSQHVEFRALDFTCDHMAPRALFDKLIEWRKAREWRGGLGLYSTFVHIDTRPQNATWGLG